MKIARLLSWNNVAIAACIICALIIVALIKYIVT